MIKLLHQTKDLNISYVLRVSYHNIYRGVTPMIKIEDIKKIVKLIIISGYIKNIEPLSLILVGDVGIGKTTIINKFKAKNIMFLTDLSMMGVVELLRNDNELTHIIIPDFLKVTMKKRSTSDNLISLLNAYTEEGIEKIRLQNYSVDLEGRKGGIITSTTRASYNQNKKGWERIGFLSRMIIVSYSYSRETELEILNYIYQEQYLQDTQKENITLPKIKKNIISTSVLNEMLNPLGENTFRTQKHLQNLAKCNAFLYGKSEVTEEDIKEVIRLDGYLNLDYNEL